MKFFIVLLAVVAAVCAEEMASESMKTKRGLHLSLGSYHAPAVVSHSYVAPAPLAVAHHAPLVAAPVYTKTYVHHAPAVVHHAPALAAYHAPAYHAPAYVAHAPLYHSFHRR
ncbi:larval cuticle protein F1-like [Armigeres subalbatus]|uniref:larval cuticle protein F1-like n=1 Tax=Armigeres subalbatus TaxID=124917 RepID=UPI002ED40012